MNDDDRGEVERMETSEDESCRRCWGANGTGIDLRDGDFGVGEVGTELEDEMVDDPLAVRVACEDGVRSEAVEVDADEDSVVAVGAGLWKCAAVMVGLLPVCPDAM